MGRMLRSVAVIVQEPVLVFELGVFVEVFGTDRTDDGIPAFDFRVCAERPGTLATQVPGVKVTAEHDLSAVDGADLVAIAPAPTGVEPSADVVAAIRRAHSDGAYVLSVCTGAFTLAATGLLAGRTCTTHWREASELAERHPDTVVDSDRLYTHEGRLITSAGTAGGIDACLHLVRYELGPEVANTIARRMVVPPHRDGGQDQYVISPVRPAADDTALQDVLDWSVLNVAEQISVDDMAQRARMSSRTFSRRFSAAVGSSPHHWLTNQRLLHAQRLLEQGAHSVEEIARSSGFGTGNALRQQFRKTLGVSPTDYRHRFATAPTT